MKKTTISTKKHVLKHGFILGVMWVVYGFIRHLTNNITTNNWALSLIELSIYIGAIVFGIYTYKSLNNGFLKLGQALKVGLGIVLISTGIQILWDIILFKILAPDILDQLINLNKNNSADKTYRFGRKNDFLFSVSLGKLIGNVVLGIIVSLLGGAILQKNPDPFE
ncbi:DUF4199 domain-containing protein [Aquimarina sp. AU474]|uniref:DUF4199 domain-containing protein n=1 Tax=Aquimarina sp. AU474 TaxID=2108529 RepID=UPI000D698AC8|nr:DUF4199 domain-containing protein [Aquimarina sp. AU474]